MHPASFSFSLEALRDIRSLQRRTILACGIREINKKMGTFKK